MKSRIRILAMAALFAACFAVSFAQAGERLKIEVISKGFQHDFWQQVNKGCMAAGEKYGADVNFVGPASESHIAEQIEQLSNAVNKRPDAICFAALDKEASADLIATAGAAGIPIITFDSNIGTGQSGEVLAFVATDNMQAGRGAADEMYAALKDKLANPAQVVHIAAMAQDTTSQSVGDRTQGFIDRMVELCGPERTSVEGHVKYEKKIANPKIIIDVGIPAETVDAAGNTVAQTLFNQPNLLGIYGSNEFSAKCIVNVDETLRKLGQGKVVGIGFDSGIVQVEAVRDRTLYGAITQNPYMIGYLTVETAVKAARGEKVKDIAVPFYFYTADNMEKPEIKACLYM